MGQGYRCWWRIRREVTAFFQVRISHVLCFISICDLFTESPTCVWSAVTVPSAASTGRLSSCALKCSG
jgi:hypothetical protein